MRNAPSFIGEFSNKKKTKPLTTSRSKETPIEKEADLREKRKQILQRLKHQGEHDNIVETDLLSRVTANDEISEKVIFSPRTAKRFKEVSNKRLDKREIKGLSDSNGMPKIVLHEPTRKVNYHSTKSEELNQDEFSTPEVNKSYKQGKYIPSFADNSPPLRKSQGTQELLKPAKISPKRSQIINSTSLVKGLSGRRPTGPQSQQTEQKHTLSCEKPPLLTSSSLEVSDNQVESLPLRRSASSQSLNERSKSLRKFRGRQFLEVEEATTASLPGLQTSSLEDYYDLSSTKSLKKQQDKLEEDFHKLEEDLNRAFTELRKYLKTS